MDIENECIKGVAGKRVLIKRLQSLVTFQFNDRCLIVVISRVKAEWNEKGRVTTLYIRARNIL